MVVNTTPVILDLDDSRTLSPTLDRLIKQPDVLSQLIEDFRDNCVIFEELSFNPKYMTTAIVHKLHAATTNIIQSEYTEVIAYHACHPVNYQSYIEHGLLQTNRELLFNQTKEVFGEISDIENIFEPICLKYLEWHEGTIGLFLSAHEETSWHACSYFLETMSAELGTEGQNLLKRFLSAGVPTMIKCSLPLCWLNKNMRESSVRHYASAVLQKMILLHTSPNNTHHNFGALGLKSNLPPERILGFINMSNTGLS